jgi:DNA-binding IclR family transcriptional regulator
MTVLDREQGDVGAVVNAVRILQFLGGTPEPRGVAAIARATGISPSTTFNILKTMTRLGFVALDHGDKTYRLGLALAELAAGFVGVSQVALVHPEMERLAADYAMLIVLWRMTDDGHMVLVDRAYSEQAVRVDARIGSRLPALIGAVGRCVAAALELPEAELRQRFQGLRWQQAPTFDSYRADVSRACERGFARDNGQLYKGIQTVGAIVADFGGKPRFGLSGITISGQHAAADLERLGGELRETCRSMSRALFPAQTAIKGDAASSRRPARKPGEPSAN